MEFAKRSTLGQLTRAMHDVFGHSQPIDCWPHIVQGCNGLPRIRRLEPPVAGSRRHRCTALGISNY